MKAELECYLNLTPFDTQILKFGLNGELSLTCLTCYRKKMNSKGCNSPPQWELEQFTSCTLSGLAQCTCLSQCSYNAQCPSARFLLSTNAVLSVCGPAHKTGCSLSCSFPCTPGFGHGEWPHSLFAVATLTCKQTHSTWHTSLSRCTWGTWAAHTCQSAVQTTLTCAQPCI